MRIGDVTIEYLHRQRDGGLDLHLPALRHSERPRQPKLRSTTHCHQHRRRQTWAAVAAASAAAAVTRARSIRRIARQVKLEKKSQAGQKSNSLKNSRYVLRSMNAVAATEAAGAKDGQKDSTRGQPVDTPIAEYHNSPVGQLQYNTTNSTAKSATYNTNLRQGQPIVPYRIVSYLWRK